MKSGTKLVLGLIAGVALLIASPILLLGAVMWWSEFRFQHLSPLAAQSLKHTVEATNDEFRRRVQEAFPLGSSVAEIRRKLAEQGFRDRQGQLRSGPAMVLEYDPFPCNYFFEVFWTSSATGRLTALDTDLNQRCL